MPQHFARDHSLPLTVRRLIEVYAPGEKGAAEAALARVGIAALADKQVATLSGGEMARVLLARAIVHRPDLLLLDEPFAGVDLAGEAALYRLIAELRDEMGCAVLLVSHDLHVVMAEASRVICLNRHICCEGAAGTVIRDPAFVESVRPAHRRRTGALRPSSRPPPSADRRGARRTPQRRHAAPATMTRRPRPWMIFCWRAVLGAALLGAAAGPARLLRAVAAHGLSGRDASPIWAFWAPGLGLLIGVAPIAGVAAVADRRRA